MGRILFVWLAVFFCLIAPKTPAQVGKDWGVERQSYADPVTGVRIWEMTTTGASDNLYFHFSNFTADNRYLIFVSDRAGTPQIFRAEVTTGRLTQLTEGKGVNAHGACPDHTNARRVYYTRGADVIALAERKIAELRADIDAHRSLSESLTFGG